MRTLLLVGIELNPGPRHAKKKNPKTSKKSSMRIPRVKQATNPERSRGLLSNLGGALGAVVGGPAGSVIGSAAGSLLSRITGYGAYKVASNTILSGAPPSFSSSAMGVEICHREFIADITGSTAFQIQSVSLNPGLSSSYPWLSQLAENFETYEILGQVYEYRPSSGSAVSSSSSALGTVIFATDYDASNPQFQNKQSMESYEFSTSCVPFEGMLHPIECAPRTKPIAIQYVRTGAVTGEDLQFYDLGTFQYATQGMQAAYVVGELWVSYHIRFLKPRMPIALVETMYLHLTEGAAGTASATAPFGTTGGLISANSTIPATTEFWIVSTNTVTLNDIGRYLINGYWVANSGTVTAVPGIALGSSLTLVSNLVDGTTSAGTTFSSTKGSLLCIIDVDEPGNGAANTITVSGLTGMVTGTCDLFITKYPLLPDSSKS